ncbi:hypothetical protein SAMN04487829_0176 [Pseudobutyrivibrio sp. NOR37]|uniref:Uncharacterized protein n=2 Tax=Pseudobutyrivibrio TaxID=46205 RepID=A0A2G3DY89_9FIRM|nr:MULTISPECIES: hypothetical protein [Pseudobutyrivibrio]NEX00602.1 hypothetical protein [Pseudobutyrivibrio xylanivorans]PHU35959.1 hypothetical protein CSX01_01630 [Pseudobutyrivibrio ruminis]SFR61360.1 hypothetical protein SAMN04487829_0176 [Pseudobutyrivibrio sp. NOR37]
MLKLFKYEFRKSLAVKVIILCITALIEFFFLIGLYGENDNIFAASAFFLFLMAFVATVIIGVHSMRLLKNDLNTKQAYMLFMTPNNSYKILGAKVIENGVSIFLAGAFYLILATINMTMIVGKYGRLSDMLDIINAIFAVNSWEEITLPLVASYVFVSVSHWLYIIAVAFFAIVLSATFFNGKKWNSFASIAVFIGIVIVVNILLATILGGASFSGSSIIINSTHNILTAVVYLVLSAVMYVITAWIMDNSLSV